MHTPVYTSINTQVLSTDISISNDKEEYMCFILDEGIQKKIQFWYLRKGYKVSKDEISKS